MNVVHQMISCFKPELHDTVFGVFSRGTITRVSESARHLGHSHYKILMILILMYCEQQVFTLHTVLLWDSLCKEA